MNSKFYTYKDLEQRYNRSRKSIWRLWAKEGKLPPPLKVNTIFLGWTEEQLQQFERGEL
ncbi:hypothetical protein EDC91_1043 [Shewanella fodinae]|uniref:AlpA family transcriptional regulator n=1 Tax=Shewanella fodinae TaxID=552357 RepID=A0A4R2FHW1_9GAMM|nr:hypothetical protein EDC91_1043 [Shewanella fodinae]